MKKLFTIIITIFLSISMFSLTACGEEDKTSSIYDTLNSFLNASYTDLIITIDTENSGLKTQSKYNIIYGEQTTLSYYVEELNEIEVTEDGYYITPESYKTVYEGNATYENGKITKINGDDCDISPESIDATKLTFSADYFKDVEQLEYSLNAQITEIDKFLGAQNSGYTGAKLEVTYTLESLVKIQITFVTSNNSNVKVLYMFNNIK